jgi:hydrogenase expression/formation protein HypE
MSDRDHILLAHGGGGQLTAELLEQVVLPALGGSAAPATMACRGLTDAACLPPLTGRIAFTTDSYVVQPLEFPGGDIGKLAVCGTINDLAVVGAAPKALSLALVLEEGLEIEVLRRVLLSAGRTAREEAVPIVTGDTKVVERGALNGLVINTAGIGEVLAGAALGFDRIQAGDRVVLSGPLGEHGLAVLCRREGLAFQSDLRSDCASLAGLVRDLLEALGPAVRFMRDPTRGGLAATLAEIALATNRDLVIQEKAIPVNSTARAAAEMLGLDLLTVANEGKLAAVVAPEAAGRAVEVLARHKIASRSAVIGTVGEAGGAALVELETAAGGRRIVQMPYGEELPRIC